MSVNFMWSLPSKGKCLKNGTSSDVAILERVFGTLPRTFTQNDVEKLQAMAVVEKCTPNIYEEIEMLIALNDAVNIWPDYG